MRIEVSPWDEAVWRAIEGATVLQQVMREKGKARLAYWFALSHIEQQREKGVERREEKNSESKGKSQQEERREKRSIKKPPEMPKMIDSKVDWPQDCLQSLDFCRMGGLAGSEKKAVAT